MNSSLENCNCMIRYGDGSSMPAIRNGDQFTDPRGLVIVTPDSFEDMHHTEIARLMQSRGEVMVAFK